MLSHASDNAAESYWQRRCQGDLAMARCRCQVMLTIMLSSYDGDGAVEATWPPHDVDAESY
jgi:hypothetical protein